MKKNLVTAVLMTFATTILLGVAYPLVVTAIATVLFPANANGQLIQRDGKPIGSRIIGQAFTGPGQSAQLRVRATFSDGTTEDITPLCDFRTNDDAVADVSNLGEIRAGKSVPADLVTTSASGLDPHISPASAEFQVPRVSRERGMRADEVQELVAKHTADRQLGFLGEPRVNVLELNLDLDSKRPLQETVVK